MKNSPIPKAAATHVAKSVPPTPVSKKPDPVAKPASGKAPPRTGITRRHAVPAQDGEFMSYQQIMAALGISRTALNTLLREGRGPTVIAIGTNIKRVRKSDFEAWLASCEKQRAA